MMMNITKDELKNNIWLGHRLIVLQFQHSQMPNELQYAQLYP